MIRIARAPLCAVALALCACASNPPPPVQQPVAAVAADNGQPRMQAALVALGEAKAAVQTASANKGGHREAALGLIDQAIAAVNEGIAYANAHAGEVGTAEGPAAPEPVDNDVAGADRQPHMHRGVVTLREARRQLLEARHDKGGHRVQAINLINQAISQLKEGIAFANSH